MPRPAADAALATLLGAPAPAPSNTTAAASGGTAPTVSSTPGPGQGVALTSGGLLPPSASATGLRMLTADPASPLIGEFWFRTDLGQMCVRTSTGTTRLGASSFGLASGRGGNLTAASTITVTNQAHEISGATTIDTITCSFLNTAQSDGMTLILFGTAAFTISSAGNVNATSGLGTRTVPAHQGVLLAYSNAVGWRVVGVGS